MPAPSPIFDTPTCGLVIPELNSLAVRSLISLFDEQRGVSYSRLETLEHGPWRNQITSKDSMIAVLGLQRLAESGARVNLDTTAIQTAIFKDAASIGSAEHLGLLTWVTALCRPEWLPQLFSGCDFDKVLNCYGDARLKNTRGLAWLLSGIAHAQSANPRAAVDLVDVAVDTYHLLLENQSEYGLFRHCGAPRSIRDIVSKRFGTFGDQMHAIYAFAAFARAFDIDEPLDSALMCANCVCGLQGDRGQWWFLYDTSRGSVASRYPVRSANQDGIGPAALLALGEVTNQSFQSAVWRGLSWIWDNELGADLRAVDQDVILDAIDRQAISRYWESARSYLRIPQKNPPKDLRIRHESRPDHPGWLLYAFGNFGLPIKETSSTIGVSGLHAENIHGSN
jgi:hypothetical protein